MTWRIPACVLFSTALCASLFAQSDLPTRPVTVTDNPRAVRFTVGHSHFANFCYGYLDITADTVSFRSLTQPEHSFSVPRSSVTNVKRVMGTFVHFTTTRNWDFALVQPKTMADRIASPRARGRYEDDPSEIVRFLTDFDSSWNAEWAQQHPKPVLPPEPPKPTVAVLKVTSHPGGAQVYVDDMFKGQTGDNGDLVLEATPGEHVLRVDLADYKEWKEKVTLTGARTDQTVDLVKRGPEPLSADEIDQALSQGMTPARCAELVKQYGVNFAMTPEIDKQLRAKGADDALLLTIAENKR